ncbi:hypothetical protein [Paenibacillus sp. UNC451MF]|uniref:hypothetical protein n=1 Tax=Paenibacillus sp. UNC451MF TaxID=1449063 RepID=UPI00048B81F9|nr:hypothetical protein [Paenibacillus sp. UNC451MF]
MKKQVGVWLIIITAVVATTIWYNYLSYENVDVSKTMSGETVKQIVMDLTDVDLVVCKSNDGRIAASLSGEKAKADEWTLETYVKGAELQIQSVFKQRAYLNYKDKPRRELVVSLPEQAYDDIRLNWSANWRNASLTVQAANGEIQVISPHSLEASGPVDTPFGPIRIVKSR